MKIILKTLILTGVIGLFNIDNLSANGAEITYRGSKGEYTINRQAGTYRGCVYNTGCISLSQDKNSWPSHWKNGNYVYTVDDFRVAVYHHGRLIFQDSFKEVGECTISSVYRITSRLVNSPGSGTDITFANGIGLVSYDIVPAAQNSRINDPVRICLISIPQHCPPGDDRGRFYSVQNLRTNRNFRMYDSQHLCGGA